MEVFQMWKKIRMKLKEKLDKINEDDRGSAFVFVIIGVMFVSIVGATVLSLATNYVTAVIVDHYSTDNFYQTEGYLSEVRSGIEELAGEVNEKAYLDVMENYTSVVSTTPAPGATASPASLTGKKYEYGKQYLAGIVRKLNDDPVNPEISGTNDVFKNIQTDKVTPWATLKLDKIKKMTTNPGALSSIYGPDLQYRFNYDSDSKKLSLTIRGLLINYTDDSDYHTNIQTDINIGVPDYAFEGNSTFDQLKHFISISDDIFSVGSGSSMNAGVIGSVYSGTAKLPFSSQNGDDKDSGIEILPNATVLFNSKQVISRGNLNIFSGSNVTMKGLTVSSLGDLWLKNIVLRQPMGGTNLAPTADINDNAYILDDTSIEDDNSTLNIGGNYYGYSYNEQNTNTAGSMRSDYSSAILINGKNTKLTSTGLTKLVLAGRTFVQRNESTPGADGTYPDAADDIMMGESLAVKSNQIAYLVPEKYIVGEHNPLTRDEIDADNILASIKLEQLKNDANIWEFVDQHTDASGNYDKLITANFSNTGNYVYLYLNFASESKANDYFSNYYSGMDETGEANKTNLDDKATTYISTGDGEGMKISPALFLIAGNIIHNYYAQGGSKQQDPNYYDSSGNPNLALLEDGRSKMKNYLGLQKTLLPSGSDGISDIRGELNSPSSELVCDVILNIDTGGTDTSDDNRFMRGSEILSDVETTVPGHSDWVMHFKNNSYTIPSGVHKGLILCAKDVTVRSDFEGLIIAGGKVSIEAGGSYKANPAMIGEILEMIRDNKDTGWWKYFRCLDDEEKSSVNVADCISYENWERNSN